GIGGPFAGSLNFSPGRGALPRPPDHAAPGPQRPAWLQGAALLDDAQALDDGPVGGLVAAPAAVRSSHLHLVPKARVLDAVLEVRAVLALRQRLGLVFQGVGDEVSLADVVDVVLGDEVHLTIGRRDAEGAAARAGDRLADDAIDGAPEQLPPL